MKKQIDYLILIEHVNREMDTAVFLKVLLESAGRSVLIGSIYFDFWRIVDRYKPRVLIIPWVYCNSSIRKLTRFTPADPRGFRILNLHHEQLIKIDDSQNFLLPKEGAKDVVHISWGKAFSKILEREGVEKSLIRETGSPRLDFYRPDMREFSLKKTNLAARFHLDAGKPWVLLVGSFALAQTENSSAASEAEKKQRDLIVRSFNGILEWVRSFLHQRKQNIELVYRPHPSEAISGKMLELTAMHENFHVIADLPIREWIINCEKTLVWRSTSAVEALTAQKPVYRLNPIREEIMYYDGIPILEDIPGIDSQEEFSHVCSEFLENSMSASSCWEKAIRRVSDFYTISKKTALLSIAEEALCLIDDENARWFPQYQIPLWKKKAYLLQCNLKRAAYDKGLLGKIPHYYAQHRDFFSEDTVAQGAFLIKQRFSGTGFIEKIQKKN